MLKRFFTPKWQHQDPVFRQQALAALDSSSDMEIIAKLATDDTSAKIRELALAKLSDISILQSLLAGAQNPQDWCRFGYRLNQVSPQVEVLTAAFVKAKKSWDKNETF